MDPGKQTGRSGRQNATAPEGAQSVRTLDRHVFLTKNVCETKTSKNTLQGGTAVSGTQNGTVPERGPIRPYPRPPCFLIKNVCEKKTSKNTLQGGTAVSGCQNGTVPEQGEIHLAYSLFANFIENDFKTKLRKIRLSEVPQFLAAKMGPSRSRAKSTYPIVSLQISLKTI